jgi:uncharacterized membrane protein YbjE (DUF340 family)
MRLASLAIAAIVIASFGLFALDQARNGTKQTVSQIAQGDEPGSSLPAAGSASDQAANNINEANPDSTTERAREHRHSGLREAIDDANDVIVSPFSGVVSASSSIWTQRVVTTLLALLVFGVGLRLVAAYLSPGRWR